MYHSVAVWRLFDKLFYSGAEPLIIELCLPQLVLLVRSEEVHSISPGGLNSIFHVTINPCHEGVDVILEASSAKGVLKVSGDNCSSMPSMYTMNSCGPRTLP